MNIGQKSYKVFTDQNGNFKLNVENTFDPGLHSIVVKSDKGDKDTGLFYIVQDSGVINKIQSTISPLFLSAILLLLLLVVVLSIENIRIGKKIDECKIVDEKKRLKKRRYYTRRGVFISVVSIIITLILAILVNNETRYFQEKYDTLLNKDITQEEKAVPVDVSGVLYEPFTGNKIAGVELTVGNVSIKTIDNGLYSFDKVDPQEGIDINSPLLRKGIRKIVTVPGVMDIVYDVDLYNSLVSLMDFEAYGKIDSIYGFVDTSISSKYTKEEFKDKYIVTFDINDVKEQRLKIGNVIEYNEWTNDISKIKYNNVVSIEVISKAQKNTFYFTKLDDGSWKYIYKNI